jgi:hypothetical protein
VKALKRSGAASFIGLMMYLVVAQKLSSLDDFEYN